MKSSQLMARLEAAGWKRIRSDGSHFTYEHPKYGRGLYAYGRPQTEVGKRNLREIENRFKLKEIERDKEVKRMAQAQTREAPAVRVRPSAPEMTDEAARLLYTQLHRDHKVDISDISHAIKVPYLTLHNYMHRGQPLTSTDRAVLWAWLGEQEHKLGLVRDRETLRRMGYGVRTGSSNAVDPWISQARAALKAALVGGNKQSDLARTIGVQASVIGGILNGRSKTIYPGNRQKIQQWIDDNAEPELVPTPGEIVVVEAEKPQEVTINITVDQELEAIQKVLAAVRGLRPLDAKRALRYVLERMD